MSVRPHNDAGAPVTKMSHGHLLGCCFAMHIDQNGLNLTAQWVTRQNRINGRKRVIKRTLHENLSQNLSDQNALAAGGFENAYSAARCLLGKVQRSNDTSLFFSVLQHVALIKGMIAKRHTIGPCFKE